MRWDYTEALAKADPGHTIKTQVRLLDMPGNNALPVHEWGAFRDQVIGTAILLFILVAITDTRNIAPAANFAPVVMGLLVVAIGLGWGTDAGYAINPARDFGPRLASFLTGYAAAFETSTDNLYFWVPIIGPAHRRQLLGVGLYDALIGRFLPAEGSDEVGRLPERLDDRDSQVSARLADDINSLPP